MTDQALAPAQTLNCYSCSTPTPMADGPLCWACRRQQSTDTAAAPNGQVRNPRRAVAARRVEKLLSALGTGIAVLFGIIIALLGVVSLMALSGSEFEAFWAMALAAVASGLAGATYYGLFKLAAMVAGYISDRSSEVLR